MALFRKLFFRKPPDGLLEISERVFVFDSCFTTDVWEEEDYKVYVGKIINQLRDNYPDASILVFNFHDEHIESRIANVLSEYDMTIMDYPRHYESCPLLPVEVIHHFLRSCESWLSLGQQNVLLMHCERGGWPVLAFMLAALLIYRKQYSGEQRTLDMIYKQAPRELLNLLSPLNPIPSQLRYLQYVSRRNVGTEWPPLDRALTLDCVIIRLIPNFDGEGGCRPIFRVYGQDPIADSDRTPKLLFTTLKKNKVVRHYKQTECELVKIDLNCAIQGDVVLECLSMHDDLEREEMMFRVMFSTAFIRSNILIVNRDEIDMLWDVKDHFPRDFRAEVLFSDMDAAAFMIPKELSCFEEKDGLPIEAFAKVQEIFQSVDWIVPNADAALNVLHQISVANTVQEEPNTYSYSHQSVETVQLLNKSSDDPSCVPNRENETKHMPLSPKTPPQEPQLRPPLIDSDTPESALSATLSQYEKLSEIVTPLDSLPTSASPSTYTKSKTPTPPPAPPSPPQSLEDKSTPKTVPSAPPPPPPPPSSPSLNDKSTHKTVTPPPPPPSTSSLKDNSTPKTVCSPPPPPPPPPSQSLQDKSTPQTVHSPTPPPPPPAVQSLKDKITSTATPPPPPPPYPSTSSPSTAMSSRGNHTLRAGSPSPSPPPPPPTPPLKDMPSTRAAPPPPPPAPSSSSKSSVTNKNPPPVPSVPPPPPNSSKLSSPTPPMPAPPLNSLSSLKGRGLSRTISPRNTQTKKLKPLHWLKLNRAVQGSLWAEAQKSGEASKAPEIDMSELESLFSTAVSNSDKRGSNQSGSRAPLGKKPEKVQLIDHRRAYNCEIMLSKVKVPLHELMRSVLSLEDSALDADQVDNLIKFCPTKEEMELLKGYNGEKEKLGKCEQFFLELMQVPRAESKLRVFSFKMEFQSQVSELRTNLNVVNSAAEQIRNSVKFKKVMQTILSLGNALNQGTARGSAIGFRLDSLLKLTETRARNNKMTLMHYLCKVLADKLPDLLDFSKDLASLEPASKIQLKYLAEEMQAISKGLEKVVQELSMCENDGPVSAGFQRRLKEFLSIAEAEVRTLAVLYSGVGRNVDALVLYFGEDPARCTFEQVISTLLNFVRMFNRSHEENCKQIELEKKKAENEKLKKSNSQKNSESLLQSLQKSIK